MAIDLGPPNSNVLAQGGADYGPDPYQRALMQRRLQAQQAEAARRAAQARTGVPATLPSQGPMPSRLVQAPIPPRRDPANTPALPPRGRPTDLGGSPTGITMPPRSSSPATPRPTLASADATPRASTRAAPSAAVAPRDPLNTGTFDDLIPKKGSGTFDDLIPKKPSPTDWLAKQAKPSPSAWLKQQTPRAERDDAGRLPSARGAAPAVEFGEGLIPPGTTKQDLSNFGGKVAKQAGRIVGGLDKDLQDRDEQGRAVTPSTSLAPSNLLNDFGQMVEKMGRLYGRAEDTVSKGVEDVTGSGALARDVHAGMDIAAVEFGPKLRPGVRMPEAKSAPADVKAAGERAAATGANVEINGKRIPKEGRTKDDVVSNFEKMVEASKPKADPVPVDGKRPGLDARSAFEQLVEKSRPTADATRGPTTTPGELTPTGREAVQGTRQREPLNTTPRGNVLPMKTPEEFTVADKQRRLSLLDKRIECATAEVKAADPQFRQARQAELQSLRQQRADLARRQASKTVEPAKANTGVRASKAWEDVIRNPASKSDEVAAANAKELYRLRKEIAKAESAGNTAKVSRLREVYADVTKRGNEVHQGKPMDVSYMHGRQPASLGAGAAGPDAPLPARPTRDVISDQADRFYKIQKQHEADKLEFAKRIKKMPGLIKDPKTQERIYRSLEGEPVQLTPMEQQFRETIMTELKQEERKLYEDIRVSHPGFKDTDLDEMDPNYMHRAVKGQTPIMDRFSQAEKDVVTGQGRQGLTKSTSSLQRRKFYALEGADGERILVAQDPKSGNLQRVQNNEYKPLDAKLGVKHDEFRPGAEVTVNGKPYKMGHARTSEIEANTKFEYHKNALANTVDNIVKLRHVQRSLAELKRLTESPEWNAWAQKRKSLTERPPEGKRAPDVPLFQDWFMDKRYANVIEDFYKARDPDWITKANQLATRALFWQPITHAMNVGAHWAVARGWDWLNPIGYGRLVKTMSKAAKEVVTMGPEMQRLMREGSAMMSPSAETREFYNVLMGKLGEDMRAQPHKWDPVARIFGVSVPQLLDGYYRGVSKSLWMANDFFMMQRVLELEEKGRSTAKAIHDAELHIPNYRVPQGHADWQRTIRQVAMDPRVMRFSPYHYGIWRSYAHMMKDLVTGSGEGRLEALGHVMALGGLMFGVYPVVEYALQQATGDKSLGVRRAGAATIPAAFLDFLYDGTKDLKSVLGSAIGFAPASEEAVEQIFNRDLFTGQQVAPDGKTVGNAVERVSHAGNELVPPLQTINKGFTKHGSDGVLGVGKQVIMVTLGLKDNAAQERGARIGKRMSEREEKSRLKHPQGLIENLYNHARRKKETATPMGILGGNE